MYALITLYVRTHAGARYSGQVLPARLGVPADPPERPRPPRECPDQARNPHGRRNQGPVAGKADKDGPRRCQGALPEDGFYVVVLGLASGDRTCGRRRSGGIDGGRDERESQELMVAGFSVS